MKVIHLNNISNTGEGLVDGLKLLGVEAELYPLKLRGAKGAANLNTVSKIMSLPWRLHELLLFNRYVKENKFDIVHIHYGYLGIAGIIGRYPYYLHVHGGDLYQNLERPFLKEITLLSIKKALKVFYSTPDLDKRFGLKDICQDSKFIPNPIRTDIFSPNNGFPSQIKRVLIIQRLDHIKGLNIFSNVIHELLKKYPWLEFTAIKIGSLVDSFKQIPRLNMVDPVPHRLMPDLIRTHDLIIGQFKVGAIGMCELESMACGKPLIANFELSGIYDIPPPIFSAKTEEGILKAFDELIGDPDLAGKTGARSREWILRYHSLENVARKLKSVYKDNIR